MLSTILRVIAQMLRPKSRPMPAENTQAPTAAAQIPPGVPHMKTSHSDIDIMVRTLYGEARGEPRAGQIAVVHVVRNRALRRGTDLKTECLRPWQFSCWNLNDPNMPVIKALPSSHPDFKRLEDVVDDALAMPDTTGGALHYFNPKKANPAWGNEGKETLRIGGHVFRAGVRW